MKTYFGIDCAKWQGMINWGKVKKDGVQFAILKATRKNGAKETAFERNYDGCTRQAIPVGVYRYVYVTNAAAATTEAKDVVSALRGKPIQGHVWLDMEDGSLIKLGKRTLLSIINAERKVLEAAGYKVGVYCSQSWYNSILPVDAIALPFWIAKYGTNNGKQQRAPTVQPNNILWGWQYSSVGSVAGIAGKVDVNVAYQSPGSDDATIHTTDGKTKILRKGDSGSAVKLLQKRLTLCGWRLTADGMWGAKTESATRSRIERTDRCTALPC